MRNRQGKGLGKRQVPMRIMMGSNVIILEGPQFPSTYAEFGVRAVSPLFLGGLPASSAWEEEL